LSADECTEALFGSGRHGPGTLPKLMRHANIKTTMGYYANVDDAVEAAVFGEQCNGSRNKPPAERSAASPADDVNRSPEGTRAPCSWA
jgi:hypothetical protein